MAREAKFGFTAGPVMPVRLPGPSGDGLRYGEVIADCRFGQSLGFDSVWMLEHHFTDYYPSPSPLLFLSHIAAACPGLGLGTAVIVLPWYEPVRFAEEVAMLSLLCEGDLHLGIGRGVARIEYEARDIDMEYSRELFQEAYELAAAALTGGPFRFAGKHFTVPREVTLRPIARRERIHFYGACNSPGTAERMAGLGLPILCTSISPVEQNAAAIAAWKEKVTAAGGEADANVPLWVHCFIADSEAEAHDQALEHLSAFYRELVKHYETHLNPWKGVKTYEQNVKVMDRMESLADPANRPPVIEHQLVGTPDVVAERVQRYLDIGVTHIVINTAQPDRSEHSRNDCLRHFSEHVAPRFAPSFGAVANREASVGG